LPPALVIDNIKINAGFSPINFCFLFGAFFLVFNAVGIFDLTPMKIYYNNIHRLKPAVIHKSSLLTIFGIDFNCIQL